MVLCVGKAGNFISWKEEIVLLYMIKLYSIRVLQNYTVACQLSACIQLSWLYTFALGNIKKHSIKKYTNFSNHKNFTLTANIF